MIYTDRKFLSILPLTEDRDYATYDELIQVLEKRPSNAIYVERDGILCGLITAGCIEKQHDGKTRRVPFNKKFTSVHPGEYLRTLQILKKFAEVPVVSDNGHLLGDYARWDDLISIDYARLLCEDPYVLQVLKENIQNIVLVKPACWEDSEERRETFLWWKHKLESVDVHLQEIYHWEIKDYHNVDKTFLFIVNRAEESVKCELIYT